MCVELKAIQENSSNLEDYRAQLEALVEFLDSKHDSIEIICRLLSTENQIGFWSTNHRGHVTVADDQFLRLVPDFHPEKTIIELLKENDFTITELLPSCAMANKNGKTYKLKYEYTQNGNQSGILKEVTQHKQLVDKLKDIKKDLSKSK